MNVRPCRSCGVLIFDAPHVFTGKPAPIEAEPAADGTIRIDEEGFYSIIRGESNLPVRYRSHFARCPQAASWRHRAA